MNRGTPELFPLLFLAPSLTISIMRSMSERTLKVWMTIAVVGPLLGVFLAILLSWQRYVFRSDILLLVTLYTLTAFGVTIGYHRMLTHRGFQASPWLRGFLLILGCMAFAGSKPDEWAATHARHHTYTDEEGDPHSPLDGFWHAHFGWLFSTKSYATAEQFAPHLLQDPVVMFVSKWSSLWMVLAFFIPFALGGWTGLLWGGVVRLFLTTHTTWSVNSVCHCFGRRPFETTDESRNNWIVGLFGFGEGWHNNHHAFPQNAFHGLQWWQFDLSGILIRLLEAGGLIWNVERVSKETMDACHSMNLSLHERFLHLRLDLASTIQTAQKEILEIIDRRIQREVTSSCEHALERLENIQDRLARSAHLRRKQLLAYQSETREILNRVRLQAALLSPL